MLIKMQLNLFILIVLLAASLWTVMTRSIIRSAIGLALSSVILTIIMFRLNSPLAAVFELSVCAGLISVLFVTTISLTHPQTQQQILQHMKERLSRFWYLPVVIIVLGVLLFSLKISPRVTLPVPEIAKDVRSVLWNIRRIDLIGQMAILLTGVFGVVVLFKEKTKK